MLLITNDSQQLTTQLLCQLGDARTLCSASPQTASVGEGGGSGGGPGGEGGVRFGGVRGRLSSGSRAGGLVGSVREPGAGGGGGGAS